jgi:hypothetical protein
MNSVGPKAVTHTLHASHPLDSAKPTWPLPTLDLLGIVGWLLGDGLRPDERLEQGTHDQQR